MSARAFLVRGLLVGLAAGILCFVVARLLGESAVGSAIAFETTKAAAAGDPPEPAMVSRTVQSTVGLLTATTVYGVAIGGIFALVLAATLGRLRTSTARGSAAALAATGFVAFFLVPFLVYPADPPAVGSPDTIGRRTALFVAMVALSLALAFLATRLRAALRPRFGDWNAGVAALLAYVVACAVVGRLMPAVDEVPGDFPATVLWHFRLATVAIQATLWATLGLGVGALTERALARRPTSAT